MMINELISLANELDSKGYTKEVDYIDKMIIKNAWNWSDLLGTQATYTWEEACAKASPGKPVDYIYKDSYHYVLYGCGEEVGEDYVKKGRLSTSSDAPNPRSTDNPVLWHATAVG